LNADLLLNLLLLLHGLLNHLILKHRGLRRLGLLLFQQTLIRCSLRRGLIGHRRACSLRLTRNGLLRLRSAVMAVMMHARSRRSGRSGRSLPTRRLRPT
jgi:hypothetical protein